MRFVNEFPAPAPFQAQRFTDYTAAFVILMFAVVFLAVLAENADVERHAEVMPRLATFRFSDDVTRLGPALSVQLILFGISPAAANNFNVDTLRHRDFD